MRKYISIALVIVMILTMTLTFISCQSEKERQEILADIEASKKQRTDQIYSGNDAYWDGQYLAGKISYEEYCSKMGITTPDRVTTSSPDIVTFPVITTEEITRDSMRPYFSNYNDFRHNYPKRANWPLSHVGMLSDINDSCIKNGCSIYYYNAYTSELYSEIIDGKLVYTDKDENIVNNELLSNEYSDVLNSVADNTDNILINLQMQKLIDFCSYNTTGICHRMYYIVERDVMTIYDCAEPQYWLNEGTIPIGFIKQYVITDYGRYDMVGDDEYEIAEIAFGIYEVGDAPKLYEPYFSMKNGY